MVTVRVSVLFSGVTDGEPDPDGTVTDPVPKTNHLAECRYHIDKI